MQANPPPLPDPVQLALSLREQLKLGRQTIIADYEHDRRPERLLKRMRQNADLVLTEAWKQFAMPASASLVAVGGYGRGELFPYSDIDLLILLPSAPDQPLKEKLEQLVQLLWDLGLEIGHSIRTIDECLTEAAADITVQTSLLEARLIYGSKAHFKDLQNRCTESMDARAFFQDKILELRQRHVKYENTPYSLEPNCKESPGGLRDLQVILWVAKAAGFGNNWDELAKNGLATPFEVRQIKRNEALLRLIRARLHLTAQRREDRLVFDLQTAVAESFGYGRVGPDVHATVAPARTATRPSEALMRRYYWAAKAVTQLNQILLLNIEERLNPSTHTPQPINPRFNEKAGMVDVASDDLYQREPRAILETFLLYQTTPGLKGFSSRTLRALYNARGQMDGRFRQDPVNRESFRQILMHGGLTHAMRLMNQTSVLGRYLWVFRRIVGQMQHDLFHVYTVDQHILMVLRNARRFFIAEHAHEYPFCSQLASGWDKPWILYVAALFHDIAKGRGGDHSELGASEARRFCRQHQMTGEDAVLIEFLVREHLTMSRVAQKSELTALYLLTVADIRGTSPTVWNAWKGKLLADLYRLTLRVLGGRAPDPQAEAEACKREALVILALHSLPFEAHKPLWDTLDASYFMRHEAADIAWHTRQLSRHMGSGKSIVRARQSPLGEGLQVMVYTPDKADLFARICGYFDQGGFSILDARIHTARNGHALDTFQVVGASMPEQYRELISLVENELGLAIAQTGPLPLPGRGRVSRRVKSFPVAPRVTLRPDDKAQRWLLNIAASDRVGLLYSVARVLAKHNINLQLAKIATLGERVDDTFLIQGAELQHNRTQIAIETELLEALA